MGKLKGKIALITGGNSGIGLATAKLFAHEGTDVFITGRRQDALNIAVAEIGPKATGVQVDRPVIRKSMQRNSSWPGESPLHTKAEYICADLSIDPVACFEYPPVLSFGLSRDGFGCGLGRFVDLLSRKAKPIPKIFPPQINGHAAPASR